MFFLRKPTVFNEINYKRYKNKLRQLINIAENYHYQKEFNKHKSNLKKSLACDKGNHKQENSIFM